MKEIITKNNGTIEEVDLEKEEIKVVDFVQFKNAKEETNNKKANLRNFIIKVYNIIGCGMILTGIITCLIALKMAFSNVWMLYTFAVLALSFALVGIGIGMRKEAKQA